MASIATIVPSLLGVGGGAGVLGLAAKKAKESADGKSSCFRIPYGHESIMTRFGMPLRQRRLYWCKCRRLRIGQLALPRPAWDSARREEFMRRHAGQWFKLPILHKQPPTDMRLQKHEAQPLKVVTKDCVAFVVSPVFHFQVVDVVKKQLEMSKWDDYLYKGIVQVITSEAGKISYKQLIRGVLDERIIDKARAIGEAAGVRVDDVGFKWKTPTAYGEVVVSREAMGIASAKAMNRGVALLNQDVRDAPAAIVASLLGPPVVTTSVGSPESGESAGGAEVAKAQSDAAAAQAEVVQLRAAQA